MSARKLVVIIVLTVAASGIGASRGLAYMKASYDGACGQLDGFPGLLQKMKFFARGNCRLKNGNLKECQDNGECTISSASGNIKGKCETLPAGCTCQPK